MIQNAAGMVVLDAHGRLLLQQRPSGLWDLPGGHLEPGESLEACAIRETLEETGVQVHEVLLLGVASGKDVYVDDPAGRRTFYVTALFQARGFEGTPRCSTESQDLGFFALQQLPAPISAAVKGVLDRLKGGT